MGLKKNIIYSSVLVTSNYIFPLITFPYISRVLGVENIGIVGFVDSFVNYFIMFSMLGLGVLGIREIAKSDLENEERAKIFSALFSINFLLTFFLLIIYGILVLEVPELRENKHLLFLGAFKLLFNLFLIEWFYKGIENFKYITISSLVLRFIYIIALFLLVKTRSDVYAYYVITTLLVVFNAVINWTYSRRYVWYNWRCFFDIKPFIKPYFSLGLYLIMTSMYTTFNVVYLGFVSSQVEVGYYMTALKIYTIILGFFTAFTNVMMPRMSALLSEGNAFEFKKQINNSFVLFFTIGFPLTFFLMSLSSDIVLFISGSGYEGAVYPMQIIIPLIVIVGIAQILSIQVLIPLKKEAVVLKISCVGAVVGLLFNIVLVSRFNAIGTAVTLLCSELLVTILLVVYVLKKKILSIPFSYMIKNLIYSLPYIVLCVFVKRLFDCEYVNLLFSLFLCIVYFAISQLFFVKNPIIIFFVNKYIKYRL